MQITASEQAGSDLQKTKEPRRVLIVKTGYAELLTTEESGTVSLGDVFRTTCILHDLIDDHVTWVVSKEARPLLPGKPYVDEVFVYNDGFKASLLLREFDLILNLERCDEVTSWVTRFEEADSNTDIVHAYANLSSNGNGSSEYTEIYQKYLFDAVGFQWEEQPYTRPAGFEDISKPTIQVGFNHAVGSKWPVKAWPEDNWNKLAALCERDSISYSVQEGFNDLEQYMKWISKHELLVSNDSLGLHLALALEKKVVGLFGPTSPGLIHFYGLGEEVMANSGCPKKPCFQSNCDFEIHCMTTIKPAAVLEKVKAFLR